MFDELKKIEQEMAKMQEEKKEKEKNPPNYSFLEWWLKEVTKKDKL